MFKVGLGSQTLEQYKKYGDYVASRNDVHVFTKNYKNGHTTMFYNTVGGKLNLLKEKYVFKLPSIANEIVKMVKSIIPVRNGDIAKSKTVHRTYDSQTKALKSKHVLTEKYDKNNTISGIKAYLDSSRISERNYNYEKGEYYLDLYPNADNLRQGYENGKFTVDNNGKINKQVLLRAVTNKNVPQHK